ncbi:helix-turn-helix transcriptional regulator [Mycobacterium heckeshornense]|uniref:Transcriptional regulator n=2 Tax=Mycobacterium heckeshornense TaxID=110505 RepID=A0A2I3ELA0_9MYCO|nr:helix-turn-helix domain-containing protein [Mycobacterium heckeshornense]KMV21865.1 transcriptional regulator [Mycobacterium heckeshornense]BCO36656.1 transcriptional regulator [Mycobacterium heckeshornense]BCQ09546.1 transcriptional regulator [Mycobacterium heckeshornense]
MSNIARPAHDADRRRAVLQVLKAATAPMSIAAIAEHLDVHPNTVRFHLDGLVRDGRVERVTPDHRRPGRPPLMFRAIRQMDRGGARRYQLLAEILTLGFADERDPSGKALAAGRAWGQRLVSGPAGGMRTEESIDHLVGLLDDLGFAPERRGSAGEHQIGLRHCPFLELAETRSSVVCPIHLGIMRGAMDIIQAPVTVDRLDAFVEPDLCVAHLGPREATT